jgi:hypothetical protein
VQAGAVVVVPAAAAAVVAAVRAALCSREPPQPATPTAARQRIAHRLVKIS